jgi:hypothetical protein
MEELFRGIERAALPKQMVYSELAATRAQAHAWSPKRTSPLTGLEIAPTLAGRDSDYGSPMHASRAPHG